MSARLRRASRLLDLVQERIDVARARLADARRALEEARAEVDRCEAAWAIAAQVGCASITRVVDLEQQSAHLRTLRLRVDVAKRRTGEIQAGELRCQQALAETSKEHRKLELWLERLQLAERERMQRASALADDEVAARTLRQEP
jgi:hypothetical protein